MTEAVLSALDELRALADEVVVALSAVLDHSDVKVQDPSTGQNFVYIPKDPYLWVQLPREHQPLLGPARELLGRWDALSGAAVRSAAPARLEAFVEQGEVMRSIVGQSGGAAAPSGSIAGVRKEVDEAMRKQLDMLADLPSAHGPNELLVVPDTNSVVFQPAIEEWKPTDGAWTFVLMPQVVRELDKMKLQRDDPVGEAATSFIRRVDGYGQRGDTFQGVPLHGSARIREVAIEADMKQAPPWLREGVEDDRLLASTLELRWKDLNARVVLVTRDRNLKNKARLARMAYVAVEDIAEPRPRTPAKASRRNESAEAEARLRLGGALPWAKSTLGVPPDSTGANPNQQSWTVQATPVTFKTEEFRKRVLGAEASAWFEARVRELSWGPPGFPSPEPVETTGQMGFAIRQDFVLPVKGSVLLVADAGGIVGARYYFEPEPSGQRALWLKDVEESYFRPLIQACTDALRELGSEGRTLLEAWVAGVSDSAVMTGLHPRLAETGDGWLSQGLVPIGGELKVPVDVASMEELVADWGVQFARAAGIRAHA